MLTAPNEIYNSLIWEQLIQVQPSRLQMLGINWLKQRIITVLSVLVIRSYLINLFIFLNNDF